MDTKSPVSLLERLLDRLFPFEEITGGCSKQSVNNPVYLKRWYIRKNYGDEKSWQIYLHKIMRSDEDRELHDHPWPFLSFILWRGYTEESVDQFILNSQSLPKSWTPATHLTTGWPFTTKKQRKFPGMILRRPANWRHRLHITGPAWTLVLTGRKSRSWGFWRDGKFIPWREFISVKCAELAKQASELMGG